MNLQIFVFVIYCRVINYPRIYQFKTKHIHFLVQFLILRNLGMVLLVVAHRFTGVTVKLSAWTAISTDLIVLEGWLTSRHFHVTAGRKHPGAACNMAFVVVSGQRERNQNRIHRVSYDLILEVVSHHFCCTLLVTQLWYVVQGTVPDQDHWGPPRAWLPQSWR